jgi:hypothetical protein
MNWWIVALAAVAGLAIGAFLGVCWFAWQFGRGMGKSW